VSSHSRGSAFFREFARKYLERARGRVTTRAGASHDDDRGDDDACVARVKGSISTRARDAATPRRDATHRIASVFAVRGIRLGN